ncbi:MAG: DUF2283 domain-containing protein [Planctomycetota bacterium]
MKFRYDPEADAAYLRLTDDEVADSEMVNPHVVLDYDAQNRVISVEFLHVRQNLPEADPTIVESETAA